MLQYSFSLVTSTNVGISLQNFLIRSFNIVARLVQNFKAISSVSSKLLNLNQEHLFKRRFFSSNPYKIEAKPTSVIEMLPNFGHMTTSTP